MKTLRAILVLFALVSTAAGYGQSNGRVVYRAIWTVTGPIVAEGTLCFTSGQSSFLANSTFAEFYSDQEQEGDTTMIKGYRVFTKDDGSLIVKKNVKPDIFKKSLNDPFNIYVDRVKGRLYQVIEDSRMMSELGADYSQFVLAEPFGLPKWSIHQDSKQIGKFTCYRATCSFRGRSYTAWFTYDIPVSYGPWRLCGLPGLILEVSDQKQEVLFMAIEVKVGNKLCRPALLPLNDSYEMMLRDYILKQEESQRRRFGEFKRIVMARASEGVNTALNVSSGLYRGLSLDYEFLCDTTDR